MFLYFVSVLAALLLLVVSNRGAMAKRSGYRSDCAGMLIVSSILLVDNFQSECQALHLFSDNQPIRGELFERGADLFSFNGANAGATVQRCIGSCDSSSALASALSIDDAEQ
ncbi:hypothetical protein ABIF66_003950 [Bradyrhizobium japonicum]